MRKAGLIVATVLDALGREVRPGISTQALADVARDLLAAHDARSSFLNYGAQYGVTPFPSVVCVSVNDEIVHGIPGERVLQAGDLVSVDFGSIVDGWHGDAARTFECGDVSDQARELSQATREAMWNGIAAARLGGRIGDISHAVEASVNASGSWGIVEDYVGHGIGSEMHQEPDVPNFGRARRGPRIERGMALCVEPMLTSGAQDNRTLDDEWTIVTRDGGLAAHWENTITVTDHGVWVLTELDGGEAELTARGVAFGPLAD